MLKRIIKAAIITCVILAVMMAPLIIPAEILTLNKRHHHASHPAARHSTATTPLERLTRG